MDGKAGTKGVSSAVDSPSASSLANLTTGGFVVAFFAAEVRLSFLKLRFFWVFYLLDDCPLLGTGMVDKMGIPFAYLDIEINSLTSTEVRIRNTVLKVYLQDNYTYDIERVHITRNTITIVPTTVRHSSKLLHHDTV